MDNPIDIKINLIQDWESLILKEIDQLKNNGFLFDSYEDWQVKRQKKLLNKKKALIDIGSAITDVDRDIARTDLIEDYKQSLIFNYYNFRVRLINNRPRQVKIPNGFSCPEEHQAGLDALFNKVTRGDSLFPHLSRQIFKPEFLDGMLFDWGIQHFHLGLTPDNKQPKLVQGFSKVLYAIVLDDCFYALKIDDHGHWANEELLRIVLNNFPEIIEPYRANDIVSIDPIIDESDRNALRKAKMSAMTKIDDKFYCSPGGGINSDGTSTLAVWAVLDLKHWYYNAQKIIIEELQKAFSIDPSQEDTSTQQIKFKMSELEGDRITVICQEHRIKFVLFYNDERNEFKDFEIIEL